MKKTIFVFLIFIIFLFACSDTNEHRKGKDTIEIQLDSYTISAGDEVYINVKSSKLGNYIYSSSDESVATIDDFGFLTALKPGSVTITVYLEADESLKASVDITITDMLLNNIKVSGLTMGHVGDVLDLKYIQYPRGMNEALTFTSKDESIATVDNNGVVTLKAFGNTEIEIVSESGYSLKFTVGAYDFSKILVLQPDNVKEDGEMVKVYAFEEEYCFGYNCFNSIKTALKYIDEGGTIYVMNNDIDHTYDEDFIINKNGVKIYSVDNCDCILGYNTEEYMNNAYITGSIYIASGIKDVEINGLTFTGAGYIHLYGDNENILIKNNVFIDSSLEEEWKTINSKSLIYFGASDKLSNNIYIMNNYFLNANVTCVTISSIRNLKITNNLFRDFNLDAIKSNTIDIDDSCQWLIKDNRFIEEYSITSPKSGYSAIYFPTFGSKIVPYELLITILDNEFKNIGYEHNNVYNNPYGAISMTGYNGGTTSVVIRHNNFDKCASCVRIDNEQSDKYYNNLDVFANYNFITFPYGKRSTELFTSYKKLDKTNNTNEEILDLIDARDNYYINEQGNTVDASKFSKNESVKSMISAQDWFKTASTRAYANNVVHMGSNSQIVVNTLLSNDTYQAITAANITYESSDKNILSVDSKGKLTPVAIGDATITIKKDNEALFNYHFKVKDQINIDYASLLVSIALEEEGYVEGSNNYTKYGVWYSGQVGDNSFMYGAWCAMFVSWCSNQADIPRTIIPLYASCSAGRQWFESRGLFKYKENYTPKTGDIIFFLSNGASHTGIVVTYKNGTVYTIEGNTSNMCAQRSYDPMNSRITGYGTPQYPVYNGTSIDFDVSNATSGEGHSTR